MMRMYRRIGFLLMVASFMAISAWKAHAFALLGPLQPWMTATNGFSPSNTGDIGGPMCISNGYRWNVPVVTYGFDQSFLKFFGTNGIAAVESAIQILNAAPPASQVILSNYPPYSVRINYPADSQSLYDLKSETLSLLLEQLGLAQPTRFVYVLRRWNPIFVTEALVFSEGYEFFETNWTGGIIPYNIDQRNFDPATLGPSPFVDGTLYDGTVVTYFNGTSSIQMERVDPLQFDYAAVADQALDPGGYYLGLTYDDVGGLRYLFSTSNINYETLLPGIVGAGTNAGSIVNGAWRPGVDKITFVPQATDSQSGAYAPMTNYFTDNYLTNGVLARQQVARIISQPDFIFTATNVIPDIGAGFPLWVRTGTTNWLNNAAANGNTNGAGPGVIQPPVQIAFNKLGKTYISQGSEEQVLDQSSLWGSFDGTTNAPINYPVAQTGTTQTTVRLWWLMIGGHPKSVEWNPVAAAGTQYAAQTSTDLTNWTTLFMVTNNNTVSGYIDLSATSPSRFYRLMPQ